MHRGPPKFAMERVGGARKRGRVFLFCAIDRTVQGTTRGGTVCQLLLSSMFAHAQHERPVEVSCGA